MANLLDFIGALSPNEDGSPNAVQRFNNAINPQRELRQLQQMSLMQELQQRQAVQSALQQWAQKGGGDAKSLYGALAATGDPSYLAKFTELTEPKIKSQTIGGNIIQMDENNPTIPPKVVYSQPTADERKQSQEEKDRAEQKRSAIGSIKEQLGNLQKARKQVMAPRTEGLVGMALRMDPSTNAGSLDATLETIKSRLSLDELAKLKMLSSTGASGLGGMNQKELEALQSSVANIKFGQRDTQLDENLGKIQSHYINFLNQEGIKTAINPKTGEVKLFMDGQWQ